MQHQGALYRECWRMLHAVPRDDDMTDAVIGDPLSATAHENPVAPHITVSVGNLLDAGPWALAQNIVLALVCFTIICDGFSNLAFGLAIPAMSHALGVEPRAFSIVFAVGFAGLTVGTVSAGPLGDRFGRKPILLLSILVFAVFTLTLAFVDNVADLTTLRFLAGLGLGGAMPNATALIAECAPARHRSLVITIAALCIPVGGMVGAVAASAILPHLGWENLFVVAGAIPLAVCPILYFILPESPKFLAGNENRRPQLVRVLDALKISYPSHAVFKQTEDIAEKKLSARLLFQPAYLRDTIALWLAFFFSLALGYFLVSWIPTILAAAGFGPRVSSLGLFAYNGGGLIGAIGAALLMEQLGSRVLMLFSIAGILLSLSFSMVSSLAALGPDVVMLALFGLGVSVNAVTSPLFAIASYTYPTAFRSVGVALALAFGRVGAIVSSYMGGAISHSDSDGLASFHVSVVLLVGSTLSLWLLRRHIPPVRRT
jgi:AAHS family 4-hydroxybenzoate transporter-like MFS transporter